MAIFKKISAVCITALIATNALAIDPIVTDSTSRSYTESTSNSTTTVKSPWPAIHPGKMMKPNAEQLEQLMLEAYNNYEKYSAETFSNSFLIHKDYNWDKVSKPAVERLKEIQKLNF